MANDIAEQIRVTFENDEHRDYTAMLLSYGFSFVVKANLQVGREYHNKAKQVRLVLEEADEVDKVDGFFEPKLFVMLKAVWTVPTYPEQYSDVEWTFLTADEPNQMEFARREVYVWTRMRPYSLNTMQRLDLG